MVVKVDWVLPVTAKGFLFLCLKVKHAQFITPLIINESGWIISLVSLRS